MPGRDTIDDAAAHDLIGQFPGTPLADRPVRVGRDLAGQGDDLAELFRRDPRRPAGLGRIRKPLHHTPRPLSPAHAPLSDGIRIEVQPARHRLGAEALGR